VDWSLHLSGGMRGSAAFCRYLAVQLRALIPAQFRTGYHALMTFHSS
jgi:hypothetical protein